MVILHLSDLHFGNKNRFSDDDHADLARGFYRSIMDAEKTINISHPFKIDIVIVSGDIAESGIPSQFKEANTFLSTLAEELNITRNRFVFLPGNHDISWPSCRRARSELEDQIFPSEELESRIQTVKLANYRNFLSEFYGGSVTCDSLAGLENSLSLGNDGWLRNFPDLRLSVAALNTSEREHDQIKGGFLGKAQAGALMEHWRDTESSSFLKIIALHHNPISTTASNTEWTIEWLRQKEKQSGSIMPMPVETFEHFVDDLAGFTGRENLTAVAKDTSAHLILHGHHHDQGIPVIWPWAKNGGAPVLSVGSFGLGEDHLPGNAPLSCQIIYFNLPPGKNAPSLSAIPLVYDGRFRLKGTVLAGAFRPEVNSRGAYEQPLYLPPGWPCAKGDHALDQSEAALFQIDPLPKPPALYAEPPYIGSHTFVGRMSQLENLTEWASASDSHSVMLYEAIGGTGKSMLTWEWITKHAPKARKDWAGSFWYSFYERGATMADFCRRALTYITGQPWKRFKDRNTAELTQPLIHHLRERPWLLVLDGLERVLISYHRFDAAQLPDDEAGLTDVISNRDPCGTINPEDEDLLRAMAAANPSKLLLTSRLVPRVFLNRSGQPIPGVVRERLPGLRPVDAELLIRSCKVTGTSKDMQSYLKSNCDCHPLVIGVLAGIITDYLPDSGNFDAWVADPNGGGKLNLAHLDLAQKRNHILSVAFRALPENGRKLLSTLALLSESVDYPTLSALNPALPPMPEAVTRPIDPQKSAKWSKLYQEERDHAKLRYERDASLYSDFEIHLIAREEAMSALAPKLADDIKDLDRRGLLQYDSMSKRFDLHPVVRGIAAGGLKNDEKDHYGQRVIDHFSQQAQNPYDQAQDLSDFDNARRIVKALLQMGKIQEARDFVHKNKFIQVLNSKFEAHTEILSIIRPFFSSNWHQPQSVFNLKGGITLSSIASNSLRRIRAFEEAFSVSESALQKMIKDGNLYPLCSHLLSLSSTVGEQNRLALETRLLDLADDAASLKMFEGSQAGPVQFARFRNLSKLGMFADADVTWNRINWDSVSDSGHAVAAHHHVLNLFFQNRLTDQDLQMAEEKNSSISAIGIRNLRALRGFWHLERGEFEEAKHNLQITISLAHKASKIDRRSEIRLALAQHWLGDPTDFRYIIDSVIRDADLHAYRHLAELLFHLGEFEHAAIHARSAYRWALADGIPYANNYELLKTRELLEKLGEPIPLQTKFLPANAPILPLENSIANVIMSAKLSDGK